VHQALGFVYEKSLIIAKQVLFLQDLAMNLA